MARDVEAPRRARRMPRAPRRRRRGRRAPGARRARRAPDRGRAGNCVTVVAALDAARGTAPCPRNPPPPVTRTFMRRHSAVACAAQRASCSRPILALCRMSTGKPGWSRKRCDAAGVRDSPAPSLCSSASDARVLAPRRRRLRVPRRAPAAAARSPTPTSAVRRTSRMHVEHRLDLLGVQAPVASTRDATCGRRTTAGPARRTSRGRPCGARCDRAVGTRGSWPARSPAGRRKYSSVSIGPATVISPTSPCASDHARRSIRAIGASSMRDDAHLVRRHRRGRRRCRRRLRSRARVARSSRPSMMATGRHSVAP